MTGQEKMGLTTLQALDESIATQEILLAGLKADRRAFLACMKDECTRRAYWIVMPCTFHMRYYEGGPDPEQLTRVCHDHVTDFLHQGKDCDASRVEVIR